MKNKKLSITIGWLYPELMSTYGDRGNIIVLQKRCEWRNINVEIKKLNTGFTVNDLKICDLIFMGGAQDRQQKIVSKDLTKEKITKLKEMIEKGTPGLYICGAYQFLGKYYKEADGTIIDGLGTLDLYTESPGESSKRLIGNIVVQTDVIANEVKPASPKLQRGEQSPEIASSPASWRAPRNDKKEYLVGFENHGGRTYLGKEVKPLAKVITGFGNNGEDQTEGAVDKNSFGTYLHGPILPKNPHFADFLIKKTLEVKYKKQIDLSPLDDSLEWQAHKAIANRLGVSI